MVPIRQLLDRIPTEIQTVAVNVATMSQDAQTRRERQLLAPRRTAEPVELAEPDTVEEAADSKAWISGKLVKWFPEKAFGFIS